MHTHSPTSPITNSDTAALMRNASLFSLVVGSILVIMKAIAWSFSDSLSLLSSLADSMLDVMASTVNFVAIRYALQPPDDDHRFGHGKAEDLATFAQSTFICGSGLFLIIEGVKRLFIPQEVHNSMLGIGVMLLSIVMSLGLVLYQRHVVRKTNSTAIEADSLHYAVDLVTNAGVIVALVLNSSFGISFIDPIIALLIAVYILYGAWSMGVKAFHHLMDREFSESERCKIEEVVSHYNTISNVHDLRTRKSGIYCFIQFHLTYKDEHITLKQAHAISSAIEKELKALFENSEILIHQDPV